MSYRHEMRPPQPGQYDSSSFMNTFVIAAIALLIGVAIGFFIAPNHTQALSNAAAEAAETSKKIRSLEMNIEQLKNQLSQSSGENSRIKSLLEVRNNQIEELNTSTKLLEARILEMAE